jgi:ankyrin repeat protein
MLSGPRRLALALLSMLAMPHVGHSRADADPSLVVPTGGSGTVTVSSTAAQGETHQDCHDTSALETVLQAVQTRDISLLDTSLVACGFQTSIVAGTDTALSLAASLGHAGVVKHMLSKGVPADAHDSAKGRTPLIQSMLIGRLDIAKALLAAGADPNLAVESGETPLLVAVRRGDREGVTAILNHPRFKVCSTLSGGSSEAPIHVGDSPLLAAAESGAPDLTRQLLAAGFHGREQRLETGGGGLSTPLMLASRARAVSVVRDLLSSTSTARATLDIADAAGFTPLVAAAHMGFDDVVDVLLSASANVNVMAPNGWSALRAAVESGRPGVVWRVLEATDVAVNAADSDGRTPLFIASEHGDITMVNALLARGADPALPAAGFANQLPVHAAAINSHVPVLARLMKHTSSLRDATDNLGRTPMHFAVLAGCSSCIEYLWSNLASFNTLCMGESAIDTAARSGNADTIALLMRLTRIEPRFKRKGASEVTPSLEAIPMAAFGGHATVVSILRQQPGWDVHKPNAQGVTPLMAAAFAGHSDVARELVEGADASISDVDTQGRTVLHTAAMRGDAGISFVQYIVSRGGNIDSQDNNGATPLHLAAAGGHSGMVENLLQLGASKTIQDNEGSTAERSARSVGFTAISELLESW